ncbi:MAG: AAA family ATPase [Clostridia bacterium]|nr:AAA family ATPase [Clostridia bacterium]
MKNFFEEIYNDYFGIEKIEKQNEKLREELRQLGVDEKASNMPKLEVGINVSETNKQKFSKEEKDKRMADLFAKIDNLYITEESKKLLKKMIEYMRKYDEKIEKNYIPFNVQLISKNSDLVKSVKEIIMEGATIFSYIKSTKVEEIAIYQLESADQVTQLYADNGMIMFKELNGFSTHDEKFQEVFLNFLEDTMNKYLNNTITFIVGRDKLEITNAFAKRSLMLEKYFEFQIEEVKPDVQDVLREVVEKLKDSIEFSDEMNVKLLDYISNTYPKTSLDFPDYRNNLCKYISFNGEIPTYEQDKTLEEIFAELNELVGLQKVKKVLNDLVDLIELKKKSKDDLKIKDVNLHMVFLGNPGTGKTTVARIIAEVLYNLKYIKQNKLIEVSSKDLVGEFVGQTAPKTMGVVEKALGGVLFIDEAYSLASNGTTGSSYNEEAIATLIQAMENYRDNLVVIFAGYTKEMQAFLNSNSGIVSRIGYTLEFDDYTPDELIEIFKGMMKKSGFVVADDAIEEVRKVIEEYKDTKNFGNARFVRNVYEKSILKHAANTRNKTSKKVLKTITKEDISTEDLLKM